MIEMALLRKNGDNHIKGWLDKVSIDIQFFVSENEYQYYSLMIPISRFESLLYGIIETDYDERTKEKFLLLCKYRINKSLISQAWILYQDNLENHFLRSLCLLSRTAWNGKDYSELYSFQMMDISKASIVKKWVERIGEGSPEEEIPKWVRMLSSSEKTNDISSKEFLNNLCGQLLSILLDRIEVSDFSVKKFLDDLLLLEKSDLVYHLLLSILNNSHNHNIITMLSRLISKNVLPWSDRSGDLISAYLIALEPSQYDSCLCGDIMQSVSSEILIEDMSSTAYERLLSWQRISLVEEHLNSHELKRMLLAKYFDMIINVQEKEKSTGDADIIGRDLLIYYKNIVVYDKSDRPEELIIFPINLFRSNEQDIDIFVEIEARQAILREEAKNDYSDSFLRSLKEGKGSQALCLKTIRGASLLYANEVLSILLGPSED